MRIAFAGCGYVADLYMRTLHVYPQLELVGVTDLNTERRLRFEDHYNVTGYATTDDLLNDAGVDVVVNLTNPRSHFEVTREALKAGKHVYSEKPLAMEFEKACELVALAKSRGLHLSCAPCNLLGESAQAAWRAIREGQVGHVRLAYAELDDGMMHLAPFRRWVSASGAPWPYEDEFEVGCTVEHAGYYLTWLTAFFGPAEKVAGFGSCIIPGKVPDVSSKVSSPDFTVACVKFRSGVVARITCSIVAPHNHCLRVIGDRGVLSVADCWDYRSPVRVQRRMTIRRRMLLSPWRRRIPLPSVPGGGRRRAGGAKSDFARGVAELSDAIAEGRQSRLSPEFCLHVNEIALAIHHSGESPCTYRMQSTFDRVEPMSWAL